MKNWADSWPPKMTLKKWLKMNRSLWKWTKGIGVFPQLILLISFHYPIRNAIWNSTSEVTLSKQNATHCGWGQPHIDLSKENSVKSWWSKQVQIRIPMKRCSSSLRLKLVKTWLAKSLKKLFRSAVCPIYLDGGWVTLIK